MAPPPEYDKEPKAPDKSVANLNEDIKTVLNLGSDQQTNCENKSTGAASTVETQDEQQVEALDEGGLKALLDEVMTYKCPKDREGKSTLFNELLEKVEQDEKPSATSVQGAWGRSAGRRRGRRALPQSNSMQDLVALAALGAAEGLSRRRTSPVSSRGKQGGSLPSVDTYHQESGSYVATVHCVNPTPHAPVERRVSASDAHSPAELELLHNRRSKVSVYAPTYTARASLEIGSGSVCSGRAVTTTTASNQVRTHDTPQAGGGRAGPRGPTVQPDASKYKHAPPVKKFIPTHKNVKQIKQPEPPKENLAIYGPPDSTIFKELNRKIKYNEKGPVSYKNFAESRGGYKESAGPFIKDISEMFDKDDRYDYPGAPIVNERCVRNHVKNDVYPASKAHPSIGRGFPKEEDYIQHRPTCGPPEAIFLDRTRQRQNQTNYLPKKMTGKVNVTSDSNNNSGANDKYSPGNKQLQNVLPNSKNSKKEITKSTNSQVDRERQLPDSVKELGEIVPKKGFTTTIDNKAAKVSLDNKLNAKITTKTNKKSCQNVIAQTKSLPFTKGLQVKTDENDIKNNEDISDNGVEKAVSKEIIPEKSKNLSDNTKLSSSPNSDPSSSLSKSNIPKENNVINKNISKIKKHESKQKYIDENEKSKPNIELVIKMDNKKLKKNVVHSADSEDKSKSETLINVKRDINDCDNENSEKNNTLNKLVSECDNKFRKNDCQTLVTDNDVNNKEIFKQVSISSLCLSGPKIPESEVIDVKGKKRNIIENGIPIEQSIGYPVKSDNTIDLKKQDHKEECSNKCEVMVDVGNICVNSYGNRDNVIIEMPDDAEEMQEIDKVAIETIENAAYEEKDDENIEKTSGQTKEADIDAIADPASEEKIVRNFDFSLLSGEQLIFTRLHNNAFIFLELPNHLCVPESNNQLLSINNSGDNSNVISVIPLTKYLQETNRDDVHKTPKLKENKSKKRSKRSTNTLNTIDEVDSGVPFSCITSPEVVASCNTTSSTSQAVAIDPKPRSVFASSFNGIRNYGSSNCAIEDKKSLDENGNSVQGYSLTGSSQIKKNRKKKSSKNETVINIDQMDGYQGNKDVNELLRFIESDALDNARGNKFGGKSKNHKDDSDEKGGKKRSSERRTKDKENKLYKVKRATSMEELSSRVSSLPGGDKESRRSWDDAAPSPPSPAPPLPTDLERDFQTVTKRKRPRRRPVPDLVQCCRRESPARPDVLSRDHEDLHSDPHNDLHADPHNDLQADPHEDLAGLTFGFDLDPALLALPPPPPPASQRPPHHHHVRPGLYYRAPPTHTHTGHAQLDTIVAYISNSWDDIIRCGSGKVRFYSE